MKQVSLHYGPCTTLMHKKLPRTYYCAKKLYTSDKTLKASSFLFNRLSCSVLHEKCLYFQHLNFDQQPQLN